MTRLGAAKDLVKNKGLYVNNDAVLDARQTVAEADLLDGRFIILSAGAKKRLVVVAS